MQVGPKNLITDVPGLRVGNASDDTLKSGSTVLLADKPFIASVDVMGGAPGTRETDLLAPDKMVEAIDALVLSGGSAFGLDAATGVQERLRQDGRGFALGPAVIPIVPAAIIFDLLNGGDKDWDRNPYYDLGVAAYNNAATDFDIGTAGAGTGALTAMHKGGLGSASFTLDSGHTVGALVAANPIGAVTQPNSRHFWAAPFEQNGEFGGLGPDTQSNIATPEPSRKVAAMAKLGRVPHGAPTNTTVAIIATDAPLTKAECKRLATAAHDGMARAIMPSHTPHDGDLIFALSTNPRNGEPPADLMTLGNAAAHCIARSIARAVYHATPADNDLLSTWAQDTPSSE
ncbi:P1 family peptidase [Amylibacter sp. IMCC11727]|uniref:P1 family peptidase n=1 Tax=Amylibacter sp. IMCC11727 TaxID=3039851 RepID=UPI00244E5045|nr:P1 family peptidase [Amylibacter sp. IMCC11727]WGI21096.1 P1 family peptidase [Amylibacter sp. IMCC11727]